jgi:hypothetical protein
MDFGKELISFSIKETSTFVIQKDWLKFKPMKDDQSFFLRIIP